jgi:hypothetical protein
MTWAKQPKTTCKKIETRSNCITAIPNRNPNKMKPFSKIYKNATKKWSTTNWWDPWKNKSAPFWNNKITYSDKKISNSKASSMRGKNKQSASQKNYKNTPSNSTNTNSTTANKTISLSICHAKTNPTNHIKTQINSIKIPPAQNAPTSSNS